MNEVFINTTTPEIDAKLAYDILRHREDIDRIIIAVIFVIIFLFRGFIGYWLKFGIAVPHGYTKTEINVSSEPVQINYDPKTSEEKSFIYSSLLNKRKIKIIPQAHYELSGLVVAKNHDFLFVNDFFDSAALYDLGASWGEIGKKDVYRTYFKSYSSKTELTGSRILWTRAIRRDVPYSNEYIISHFSHSHLVPANRNIMAALLKVNRWENIKIEGELTDMELNSPKGGRRTYKTSMSRTDTMPGDRGNGNCETVYVTRVQIGHWIYE